jgi:uncharacterized membrane protein YfcA
VLLLGVATFAVSLMVSAIGPTGGLQLVAVTATMPPQVAIPMHAWTTGFSALFRALTLRAFIDWRYLRPFIVASAVGSAAIALVYAWVDFPNLQLLVASYILVTSVGELARVRVPLHFRNSNAIGEGIITGAASMLVGASGPLLMTLMKPHEANKERLVGTFSAGLTFQHLSKLVAFGTIGVRVFDYPWILLLITVAAAAGTWVGSRVLMRLDERTYRNALSVLLAATSAWLIVDALRT